MAGLSAASVICEIMNPDGSMARMPELLAFAKKHGLKIGTIADLIKFRSEKDPLGHGLMVDPRRLRVPDRRLSPGVEPRLGSGITHEAHILPS